MIRLVGLMAAALVTATAVVQDDGWVIDRLEIRYDVQQNGTVVVNESIDVDFTGLSRHGILRDIRRLLVYDAEQLREYAIELARVTNAAGQPHRVKTIRQDDYIRFQIGDPDRTVSGKQTYRLEYTIGAALNGFPDHDELYWNASGIWPVPVRSAQVVVHAPNGAVYRARCFQGVVDARPEENQDSLACRSEVRSGEARYISRAPIAPGEQLTIVAGLRKGAVAEPSPRLIARPRTGVGQLFELTPVNLAMAGGGLLLMVAFVGRLWWKVGRDRRYISLVRSSADAGEEPVPPFGARPIGVQFEPPDRLRPAQIGLLIDERADTLDVTATIIDLAVRGYLTITELPKEGWFGKADWRLTRLKDSDADLLEYERIVMTGLFGGNKERLVSELKDKFHTHLAKARKALYADAVTRGWFPRNPNTVRTASVVLGLLAVMVGAGLTMLLAISFGAGLIGLPVIAGGVMLMLLSRAMPRRTAAGRDLMYRALGFGKYVKTGETRQQEFAERAQIFTEYLPYAMVFKCVDRWALAFKDIDTQAATAGFYAGASTFDAGRFTSSMGAFSSSVSSSLSSTPGGSGSSGFGGGGSSGGGGGGGGGGSW